MNTDALAFFERNYAPGRVGLIGSHDPLYKLIRIGQSLITSDGKPSRYNHVFLMGDRRGPSNDIYILESDFHVSVYEVQLINGPQESKLTKWCLDSLDCACVVGMDLTASEEERVVGSGLDLAYDDRYRYPLAELIGTLWAILTKTLFRRNVFDEQFAVQCATFVRMCYQSIDKDPLEGAMDHLSNTSPERIVQSGKWTFRKEWVKGGSGG